MLFFTIHNFCKERTFWILAPGGRKHGGVTGCMYVCMYVRTSFELSIESITRPNIRKVEYAGNDLGVTERVIELHAAFSFS